MAAGPGGHLPELGVVQWDFSVWILRNIQHILLCLPRADGGKKYEIRVRLCRVLESSIYGVLRRAVLDKCLGAPNRPNTLLTSQKISQATAH